MWNYEKRLQYPVKITQTNPKIAQVIISQFGGPDGELAASMRYLSQRYSMPYKEVTGTLTDIGTEELAHMEMICSIVYQLTKDLTPDEIERSGFAPYYVDHTLALWPQAASGMPWRRSSRNSFTELPSLFKSRNFPSIKFTEFRFLSGFEVISLHNIPYAYSVREIAGGFARNLGCHSLLLRRERA